MLPPSRFCLLLFGSIPFNTSSSLFMSDDEEEGEQEEDPDGELIYERGIVFRC